MFLQLGRCEKILNTITQNFSDKGIGIVLSIPGNSVDDDQTYMDIMYLF